MVATSAGLVEDAPELSNVFADMRKQVIIDAKSVMRYCSSTSSVDRATRSS